jgi:chromosome segregation ATPase
MGKKDLRGLIDGISDKEDSASRLENKVQRLTELVERQKKIISEQKALLDTQQKKLSASDNLTDDVIELKRLVGEQRAAIKDKDIDLDHTKGSLAQAQTELNAYLKRTNPQQLKLEGAIETIGNLKAELAEKNTQLNLTNESLQTFVNRIKEKEAEADTLKIQLEEITGGISKEEFDGLKVSQSEERQKLKQDISKLETQLLDQEIKYKEQISEAKDMAERFDEMKATLTDLSEKNETFKEEIKKLNKEMEDLRNFKKDNYEKIFYLDKLRPAMEEDSIFKAFFIIQDVGSISLEDLRQAVGSPIVTVKREMLKLDKLGAIKMNDEEHINSIKFD